MDTQSAEETGDVDVGGVSSTGEAIRNLGNDTTTLTSLELDLACFSEKVVNLSIFVMHLETLGGELEALLLDKDNVEVEMDSDCVVKGLEFDLLCGVLSSEVRELGGFLNSLHSDVADAGQRVSSSNLWQDKLRDSEQSLKLSEEQFYEIEKQFSGFQRTLSSYKREEENGNVEEAGIVREDDQSLNVNINTGIKMQTIEGQRHILRMLEKSLANEIELEKNLNESRQREEKLKLRMGSLEKDLILMEEEATDVWERWLDADNARGILMEISKDLLGRLQISQFHLNGLSQHESELRGKLQISIEQVKARDITLDEVESNTTEMIESLKNKLRESELQLQHAVATAEASQEKQSMLYSTVKDMDHVIKDLKSKVSKAESRADGAEEKCIILSESNADLNEELSFSRGRLECMERSLNQMEETKVATANDIGKQTRVFKNLLTQLAVERERLNKQLSSLAIENQILVVKLKQTHKDPSQEVTVTLASDHEVDNEVANSAADVGTVRRIDAGVLNFKHLCISVFVLLISAVTYLYLKNVNVDFSL